MKRIYLSATLLLVCTMLVLSCGEKPVVEKPDNGGQTEKPEEPPTPEATYPEVRSFDVKAGDTFELSFDSSLAWTVSTDAKWIVLSADSGQPGHAAVSCKVTGDQPDFKGPSKGNITVKVAEREFVFPVTRAMMERSLRILSASQPVTSLMFDANEGTTSFEITVEANFYWDLEITEGWPVWIERFKDFVDGKKGDDGVYRNTFAIKLYESELDGSDKTGALTFHDIDDSSYKFELPVSYKALVIPEVPFRIQCELGTDMHISRSGFFKDAEGNLTSRMMMIDFQVITENADELIVITPTGCRHGDGAGFIQTEAPNRFVSVAKTGTAVDGGVNYTMIVTPGLLESSQPKSICDMAYILVLPKTVYEPYMKYFQSSDPYYQMAFMYMRIDNYLFEYMTDAEGNKVNDAHGNIVSIPKESIRKYMLRVFVDAD